MQLRRELVEIALAVPCGTSSGRSRSQVTGAVPFQLSAPVGGERGHEAGDVLGFGEVVEVLLRAAPVAIAAARRCDAIGVSVDLLDVRPLRRLAEQWLLLRDRTERHAPVRPQDDLVWGALTDDEHEPRPQFAAAGDAACSARADPWRQIPPARASSPRRRWSLGRGSAG